MCGGGILPLKNRVDIFQESFSGILVCKVMYDSSVRLGKRYKMYSRRHVDELNE